MPRPSTLDVTMPTKPAPTDPTPESILESFFARFAAADQKLIHSIRSALRKRLPTANELAYDYTSHVVISYSPSERGIEGVVAFDARPGDMRLYFHKGPQMDDPKKLLQGSGKQTRFVTLASASDLKQADIAAFFAAAIELADVPLPAKGKGRLVIQSDGTKKRARKPAK